MFREGLRPPDPFGADDPVADARTQDGMSLKALSELSGVLVVCLPQSSWRKTLKALAAARPAIEAAGVRIVLVHMADDADARRRLEPHDLHYLARIADPARALHGALGLGEARRLLGGARPQPGAALVDRGEVVRLLEGAAPDFLLACGLS